MAITMTLNQLKKEFEEAKDPIAQINILADLNQCSRDEIIVALKTAGVDGRKLPRNRKSNDKSNEETEAEPTAKPAQKKRRRRSALRLCREICSRSGE